MGFELLMHFFLPTLSLRRMRSSGLLSKTEPADEIFKEWSNYSLNPLNSPNLDALESLSLKNTII